MALGAGPNDVRKMVVMQGMWLAIIGVCLGVGAAPALTRLTPPVSLMVTGRPWICNFNVSAAALC